MEIKRTEKTIRSSLESHIDIYLSKEIKSKIGNTDLAEIAITSSSTIMDIINSSPGFSIEDIKDIVVDVKKAEGFKCNRCWKFDSKINSNGICGRCSKAIKK